MPYTTSGEKDWLCSRCGQVSNSSEPCYDCDRKEREANPVPPPPPAPDRPTRDSSRKSFEREPNRLWQAILSFIDWLNGLLGAPKPKRKANGEQMASIGDLFEGYEDDDIKEKPEGSYGTYRKS